MTPIFAIIILILGQYPKAVGLYITLLD
ncbi:hypothetical protein ZMO1_ZMO2070 [Zymomonas mobilis subsp. mobilis ZM4 = ATCC 31821]|nr:hypothetical protein ZMO1_ZMO2070 [Zymomonas mobilis subsp. mobilis ZM4 = ATCC 31821]HCE37194.1 hypothetical protein [Zymomonas mobilis]